MVNSSLLCIVEKENIKSDSALPLKFLNILVLASLLCFILVYLCFENSSRGK